MTPDDAARILGVEPGAGREAVQRAYRLLARSSHPDAGGAAETFSLLTEARDALLAVTPVARASAPPPATPLRPAPAARWSWPLFATGNDTDNRAAVAAVRTEELDLVGIAVRGPRNVVDRLLKGARMHP